jgi:hypothetical protein
MMAVKYSWHVLLLVTFILLRFSKEEEEIDAKQHLHAYGFLNSTSADAKTLKTAIKKYQQLFGLEVTGSLNADTKKKMASRRCGRPKNIPEFASEVDKWQKLAVTYKIQNWSEPFTEQLIKQFFQNSIQVWTKNVNLQITESRSNSGDINIYFTEQDGPSNILGYAFFPENGDIFFDSAEDWTVTSSLATERTYFGWVAAHELGHALGLPHSENRRSIMFPYYSSTVKKPSHYDINNLKALYGEASLNNSIFCKGDSIDALLNIDGNIVIKGDQYWTVTDAQLHSGPFSLDLLHPQIPNNISAAFSVHNVVYFLKDDVFYKYKLKNKKLSKKLISVGFDKLPSNIDAAFFETKSKTIYFFKGNNYYMFDITGSVGKRLMIKDKKISSDWQGLPDDLEAATLLKENRALFIKGSRCYITDVVSKTVLDNQDCTSMFYNC